MTHYIPRAWQYALGILLVIGLRLIPHPPNVEPITATLMPYGKQWGMVAGAIFAFLTVVIYDLVTGTLGPWSLLTITGYVLMGIAAGKYFAKERGRFGYVWFAIVATIAYDALTGLTMGPLFFSQPFMEAVMGQIPFTAYHLVGNILFALVLSPLVEKWIVMNPRFATRPATV